MFLQDPEAHNSLMYSFFLSEYRPCPGCGIPIHNTLAEEHQCDPVRKLDWELLLLRPEIESFEDDFNRWLETPRGRFEIWYAGRARAG
jgi:hypothetical protein